MQHAEADAMTIDVSTPQARQAILAELVSTSKRGWTSKKIYEIPDAAFARIDELEKQRNTIVSEARSWHNLARDLADAVETLLEEHKGLLDDDEMHQTCCAAVGAKLTLDRARSAGVLP